MAEELNVEILLRGVSPQLKPFILLLIQDTCGPRLDQATQASAPIGQHPPRSQDADTDEKE